MGKAAVVTICLLTCVISVSGCRSFSHSHFLDAAKKAPDSHTCKACLFGVRLVDDALCDQEVIVSVTEFVINNVCKKMDEPEQCTSLAVSLIPVGIVYLRASMVPAKVCGEAGVCGNQLKSFPEYAKAHFKTPNTYAECSFCKFIITTVQKALQDPDTEEEVKEATLKACQDLPAEFIDSCVEYVNIYGDAIISMIDTMAPADVCQMVGACMPQLVQQHPLPALPAGLARPLANLYNIAQQASMASNGPNDLCDTCKIVVLEAHQMLTNPKTQKEIEQFLEQLCSTFGSYSDECVELMDEYLPMLFEVVAEYLQPDTLCAQIGYCSKQHTMQKLLAAIRLGGGAKSMAIGTAAAS